MARVRQNVLERRFHEFLEFGTEGRNNGARSCVREVLDRIRERNWRAYVVGGTLRDLMLAPPSAFPRDIDLMLLGPSPEELESAFQDLVERRTRFDGLHLVKPYLASGALRGQVLFDVWRLEDTWAIRSAGLPATVGSFVRTPFLNIDSIAIELFPRCGRRQIFECGFFDSLSSRRLEINYAPNPFPLVCIVRSLIMSAKLRFSLGAALARYIADHSRFASLDQLIEAQISHYGQVRCKREELQEWLAAIRARVTAGTFPVELHTTRERERELWSSWPPFPRPTNPPSVAAIDASPAPL